MKNAVSRKRVNFLDFFKNIFSTWFFSNIFLKIVLKYFSILKHIFWILYFLNFFEFRKIKKWKVQKWYFRDFVSVLRFEKKCINIFPGTVWTSWNTENWRYINFGKLRKKALVWGPDFTIVAGGRCGWWWWCGGGDELDKTLPPAKVTLALVVIQKRY